MSEPTKLTAAVVAFWLACGIAGAGFINSEAEFDYKWPTQEKCRLWAARDQSVALLLGVVTGPVSLVIGFAISGAGYTGWSLLRHDCTRGYENG